ncbi:MAG: nuclear transport factor 2 family protein [Burkholderiaceae bacterium]
MITKRLKATLKSVFFSISLLFTFHANADMTNSNKVAALLDSFNTGDKNAISYINPEKYIQHNLSAGDGLAGMGEVLANAPPGGFKAKVHRIFEDGDYVVTHTEYDFFGPKAGFDVFRFEDGLIVEHWDNLTEITPPNPSGRTQFDGATEITNVDTTDANKIIAESFVNDILIDGKFDQVTDYVNADNYLQHNSSVADGLDGLSKALEYFAANDMVMIYEKLHKVLGSGNFVLTMAEGRFGKAPGNDVAFYDLFRIEDGLIVEHWDVIEAIPPESEWKNQNGKF